MSEDEVEEKVSFIRIQSLIRERLVQKTNDKLFQEIDHKDASQTIAITGESAISKTPEKAVKYLGEYKQFYRNIFANLARKAPFLSGFELQRLIQYEQYNPKLSQDEVDNIIYGLSDEVKFDIDTYIDQRLKIKAGSMEYNSDYSEDVLNVSGQLSNKYDFIKGVKHYYDLNKPLIQKQTSNFDNMIASLAKYNGLQKFNLSQLKIIASLITNDKNLHELLNLKDHATFVNQLEEHEMAFEVFPIQFKFFAVLERYEDSIVSIIQRYALQFKGIKLLNVQYISNLQEQFRLMILIMQWIKYRIFDRYRNSVVSIYEDEAAAQPTYYYYKCSDLLTKAANYILLLPDEADQQKKRKVAASVDNIIPSETKVEQQRFNEFQKGKDPQQIKITRIDQPIPAANNTQRSESVQPPKTDQIQIEKPKPERAQKTKTVEFKQTTTTGKKSTTSRNRKATTGKKANTGKTLNVSKAKQSSLKNKQEDNKTEQQKIDEPSDNKPYSIFAKTGKIAGGLALGGAGAYGAYQLYNHLKGQSSSDPSDEALENVYKDVTTIKKNISNSFGLSESQTEEIASHVLNNQDGTKQNQSQIPITVNGVEEILDKAKKANTVPVLVKHMKSLYYKFSHPDFNSIIRENKSEIQNDLNYLLSNNTSINWEYFVPAARLKTTMPREISPSQQKTIQYFSQILDNIGTKNIQKGTLSFMEYLHGYKQLEHNLHQYVIYKQLKSVTAQIKRMKRIQTDYKDQLQGYLDNRPFRYLYNDNITQSIKLVQGLDVPSTISFRQNKRMLINKLENRYPSTMQQFKEPEISIMFNNVNVYYNHLLNYKGDYDSKSSGEYSLAHHVINFTNKIAINQSEAISEQEANKMAYVHNKLEAVNLSNEGVFVDYNDYGKNFMIDYQTQCISEINKLSLKDPSAMEQFIFKQAPIIAATGQMALKYLDKKHLAYGAIAAYGIQNSDYSVSDLGKYFFSNKEKPGISSILQNTTLQDNMTMILNQTKNQQELEQQFCALQAGNILQNAAMISTNYNIAHDAMSLIAASSAKKLTIKSTQSNVSYLTMLYDQSNIKFYSKAAGTALVLASIIPEVGQYVPKFMRQSVHYQRTEASLHALNMNMHNIAHVLSKQMGINQALAPIATPISVQNLGHVTTTGYNSILGSIVAASTKVAAVTHALKLGQQYSARGSAILSTASIIQLGIQLSLNGYKYASWALYGEDKGFVSQTVDTISAIHSSQFVNDIYSAVQSYGHYRVGVGSAMMAASYFNVALPVLPVQILSACITIVPTVIDIFSSKPTTQIYAEIPDSYIQRDYAVYLSQINAVYSGGGSYFHNNPNQFYIQGSYKQQLDVAKQVLTNYLYGAEGLYYSNDTDQVKLDVIQDNEEVLIQAQKILNIEADITFQALNNESFAHIKKAHDQQRLYDKDKAAIPNKILNKLTEANKQYYLIQNMEQYHQNFQQLPDDLKHILRDIRFPQLDSDKMNDLRRAYQQKSLALGRTQRFVLAQIRSIAGNHDITPTYSRIINNKLKAAGVYFPHNTDFNKIYSQFTNKEIAFLKQRSDNSGNKRFADFLSKVQQFNQFSKYRIWSQLVRQNSTRLIDPEQLGSLYRLSDAQEIIYRIYEAGYEKYIKIIDESGQIGNRGGMLELPSSVDEQLDDMSDQIQNTLDTFSTKDDLSDLKGDDQISQHHEEIMGEAINEYINDNKDDQKKENDINVLHSKEVANYLRYSVLNLMDEQGRINVNSRSEKYKEFKALLKQLQALENDKILGSHSIWWYDIQSIMQDFDRLEFQQQDGLDKIYDKIDIGTQQTQILQKVFQLSDTLKGLTPSQYSKLPVSSQVEIMNFQRNDWIYSSSFQSAVKELVDYYDQNGANITDDTPEGRLKMTMLKGFIDIARVKVDLERGTMFDFSQDIGYQDYQSAISLKLKQFGFDGASVTKSIELFTQEVFKDRKVRYGNRSFMLNEQQMKQFNDVFYEIISGQKAGKSSVQYSYIQWLLKYKNAKLPFKNKTMRQYYAILDTVKDIKHQYDPEKQRLRRNIKTEMSKQILELKKALNGSSNINQLKALIQNDEFYLIKDVKTSVIQKYISQDFGNIYDVIDILPKNTYELVEQLGNVQVKDFSDKLSYGELLQFDQELLTLDAITKYAYIHQRSRKYILEQYIKIRNANQKAFKKAGQTLDQALVNIHVPYWLIRKNRELTPTSGDDITNGPLLPALFLFIVNMFQQLNKEKSKQISPQELEDIVEQSENQQDLNNRVVEYVIENDGELEEEEKTHIEAEIEEFIDYSMLSESVESLHQQQHHEDVSQVEQDRADRMIQQLNQRSQNIQDSPVSPIEEQKETSDSDEILEAIQQIERLSNFNNSPIYRSYSKQTRASILQQLVRDVQELEQRKRSKSFVQSAKKLGKSIFDAALTALRPGAKGLRGSPGLPGFPGLPGMNQDGSDYINRLPNSPDPRNRSPNDISATPPGYMDILFDILQYSPQAIDTLSRIEIRNYDLDLLYQPLEIDQISREITQHYSRLSSYSDYFDHQGSHQHNSTLQNDLSQMEEIKMQYDTSDQQESLIQDEEFQQYLIRDNQSNQSDLTYSGARQSQTPSYGQPSDLFQQSNIPERSNKLTQSDQNSLGEYIDQLTRDNRPLASYSNETQYGQIDNSRSQQLQQNDQESIFQKLDRMKQTESSDKKNQTGQSSKKSRGRKSTGKKSQRSRSGNRSGQSRLEEVKFKQSQDEDDDDDVNDISDRSYQVQQQLQFDRLIQPITPENSGSALTIRDSYSASITQTTDVSNFTDSLDQYLSFQQYNQNQILEQLEEFVVDYVSRAIQSPDVSVQSVESREASVLRHNGSFSDPNHHERQQQIAEQNVAAGEQVSISEVYTVVTESLTRNISRLQELLGETNQVFYQSQYANSNQFLLTNFRKFLSGVSGYFKILSKFYIRNRAAIRNISTLLCLILLGLQGSMRTSSYNTEQMTEELGAIILNIGTTLQFSYIPRLYSESQDKQIAGMAEDVTSACSWNAVLKSKFGPGGPYKYAEKHFRTSKNDQEESKSPIVEESKDPADLDRYRRQQEQQMQAELLQQAQQYDLESRVNTNNHQREGVNNIQIADRNLGYNPDQAQSVRQGYFNYMDENRSDIQQFQQQIIRGMLNMVQNASIIDVLNFYNIVQLLSKKHGMLILDPVAGASDVFSNIFSNIVRSFQYLIMPVREDINFQQTQTLNMQNRLDVQNRVQSILNEIAGYVNQLEEYNRNVSHLDDMNVVDLLEPLYGAQYNETMLSYVSSELAIILQNFAEISPFALPMFTYLSQAYFGSTQTSGPMTNAVFNSQQLHQDNNLAEAFNSINVYGLQHNFLNERIGQSIQYIVDFSVQIMTMHANLEVLGVPVTLPEQLQVGGLFLFGMAVQYAVTQLMRAYLEQEFDGTARLGLIQQFEVISSFLYRALDRFKNGEITYTELLLQAFRIVQNTGNYFRQVFMNTLKALGNLFTVDEL